MRLTQSNVISLAKQLGGKELRAFLVGLRMKQEGLTLGPKAQQTQRHLREGFPGTKGIIPPEARVRNLTGDGATFKFLSQAAGEYAFSTFGAHDLNRNTEFRPEIYSRLIDALIEIIETLTVGLVGGDFNEIEALATATGQSANAMAIKSCISSPEKTEILIPDGGLYGCTIDHIATLVKRGFIKRFHALPDLNDLETVRATLKANPNIKMIFCEALNNPNVTLVDIQNLALLRNEINADRDEKDHVKLIVDLTFTTTQIRPFEWAKELHPDIVTYSATKLLLGGSFMGGLILTPRKYITGPDGLMWLRKDDGPIMSAPVAKELLESGLPTTLSRSALNQHAALKFAEAFANDDRFTVYYPGLPNHPQHEIAQRLMRDHDGKFAPSYMVRIHINPPPIRGEAVVPTIAERLINRIAQPTSLMDRIWPAWIYAVSLANDRGLLSQSSSTTQYSIAAGARKIQYDLYCGPADLRFSPGWLASPERAIEQFRNAADHAFGGFSS